MMSEEVSRGDYKFARGSEEEGRRMTLLLPLERTRVGWLVEVEAVNPWRVLHRFYGNVPPSSCVPDVRRT